MNQEQKKVEELLRACLISCKGGIPKEAVRRDYEMLAMQPIPFQKFGFSSLEAYLESIPHVVSVSRKGNQVFYEAVPDEKTLHVSSLVSRQKTTQKALRSTRKSAQLPRRGGLRQPAFRSRPPGPPSRPKYSKPPGHADYRFGNSLPNWTRQINLPPKFQKEKPVHTFRSQPPRMPKGERPIYSNFKVTPPEQVMMQRPRANGLPAHYKNHPQSSIHSATLPSAPLRKLPLLPTPPAKVQFQAQVCPPKPQRSFIPPLSEKEKLAQLCKKCELPEPVYKVQRVQKSKNFICTLRIGSDTYSNYPMEQPTEEKAEIEAAKKAIEGINARGTPPPSPLNVSVGVPVIQERIRDLLVGESQGLWSSAVESWYVKKYGEQLPPGWTALISQEYAEVMPVGNQLLAILYPPKPAKSVPQELLLDKQEKEVFPPPDLELPSTDQDWDVYVTSILTASEIGARLLDIKYGISYDHLRDEMDEFYSEHETCIIEPFQGQLVAVKVEGCWHRAEVLAISEGAADCYLVDIGFNEKCPISELRKLEQKFATLPYQAVIFHLTGFENLGKEDKVISLLEEHMLAKSVIAKVIQFEDFLYATLVDTSGEVDVDLNATILESLVPALPDVGGVISVSISYTSIKGELFVHLTEGDYGYMIDLTKKLQFQKEATQAPSITPEELQLGEWYLYVDEIAIASGDGSLIFHRVTPIGDADPDGTVMVLFIDIGKVDKVCLSCLKDLECISSKLMNIPAQAFYCLLSGIPPTGCKFTERAAEKILALCATDIPLLLKVVDRTENVLSPLPAILNHEKKVPIVELLMRQGDLLVSINNSISFDPTLFDPETVVEASKRRYVSRGRGRSASSERTVSVSSVTPGSTSPPDSLSSPTYVSSPMVRHVVEQDSGSLSVVLDTLLEPYRQVDSIGSEEKANLPEAQNGQPKSPNEKSMSGSLVKHSPENLKKLRSSSEGCALPDMSPILPAVLPDAGKLFDVFVVMAASPSNFMVQSWKDGRQLAEMMAELDKFYSGPIMESPLRSEMVVEDCYYAGLYSDHEWYRVMIQRKIDLDKFSVFFVDFGNYDFLTLDRLRPLAEEFRKLPCQAMKATLSGVKPIQGDWTPDISIEFKQLVEGKAFVSLVNDIEHDIDHSSRLVLSLIDTSTDVDMYIHQELIKMGLATPCEVDA